MRSSGLYNKSNETEQWIRLSDGCPHNCQFCYEPVREEVYDLPEIVRNKVKIMDMNVLTKPNALELIKSLGEKRVNKKVVYYEFICGLDYRVMNLEFAEAIRKSRFKRVRIAWDFSFKLQIKIRDSIRWFIKAGYRSKELTIFMVCNWKIPYEENLQKLELCKIWSVKVADCWFDNQTSPNIKPIHWTAEQIKDFRRRVRRHNILVMFECDAELINKLKKDE